MSAGMTGIGFMFEQCIEIPSVSFGCRSSSAPLPRLYPNSSKCIGQLTDLFVLKLVQGSLEIAELLGLEWSAARSSATTAHIALDRSQPRVPSSGVQEAFALGIEIGIGVLEFSQRKRFRRVPAWKLVQPSPIGHFNTYAFKFLSLVPTGLGKVILALFRMG